MNEDDGVASLKRVVQRVASRLRREKPEISDEDIIRETVFIVAPDHMKDTCPNTYTFVVIAAESFARCFVTLGTIP